VSRKYSRGGYLLIKITIDQVMGEHETIHYATDLADATGLSYEHIAKIVRGDLMSVKLDTLDKICQALNCDVGDLMTCISDN
jgi:DNA-binding Xre family transcriptional regulator